MGSQCCKYTGNKPRQVRLNTKYPDESSNLGSPPANNNQDNEINLKEREKIINKKEEILLQKEKNISEKENELS